MKLRTFSLSAVSFGFVLIQVLYYLVGVRYDAKQTACLWQLLDLKLLRDNLFESLLGLHAQPPLFNAAVGVSLKFFGADYTMFWWIFSLFVGWLFVVCLCEILHKIGTPPPWTSLIPLFLTALPSFVLYEHFLFYTHFELFFLTASVLALQRLLVRPNKLNSFLLFSVLAVLVLLRSSYHWTLLLVILLWLCFYMPAHRRAIIRGSIWPCGMVLLWLLKNLYLFGLASGSSWLGMNLANNVGHFVSKAKQERFVQEGAQTAAVFKESFSPLTEEELAGYALAVPRILRRNPAVVYTDKQSRIISEDKTVVAEGLYCQVNFNHYAYLQRSQVLTKGVFALYKQYPQLLVARFLTAWNYYFYPSSRYRRLDMNRAVLGKLENFVDRYLLFSRKQQHIDIDDRPAAVYPVLLVVLPLIFFTGLFVLLSRRLSFENQAVLFFCLFLILMQSLVGNLIEVPENNRFRYPLNGLFAIVFGQLLALFYKRSKEI